MIITKLLSGLGNQLFQYTLGRQIALNNHTDLYLDISFFSQQNLRNFKLNYFNINAQIADGRLIRYYTEPMTNPALKYKVQRCYFNLFPNKRPIIQEKESWVFDPAYLEIKNNKLISGYWQNYRYYKNIDEAILSELTLKDEFKNPLNTLMQSLTMVNSISIHIRRGDYVLDKWANDYIGVQSVDYYRKAISYIIKHTQNPAFFFFSDDMEWVKMRFSDIPNSHFIEGHKDYEDLFLMSHCKHNIISNSTFSWWAAFLNKNKGKIVIAPRQWLRNDIDNEKVQIQMPEWIKI